MVDIAAVSPQIVRKKSASVSGNGIQAVCDCIQIVVEQVCVAIQRERS